MPANEPEYRNENPELELSRTWSELTVDMKKSKLVGQGGREEQHPS